MSRLKVLILLGVALSVPSAIILSARAEVMPVGNPSLRDELLKMRELDQTYRQPGKPVDLQKAAEIDDQNLGRMKEIIATFGYPTKSMVGRDGTRAAWLIIQHADRDRAFQLEILKTMERLLPAGEVFADQYAYLFDRTHRPQRFGTQGRCIDQTTWQPLEIEDKGKVDQYRAEVGLPPLEEYVKKISEMACQKLPSGLKAMK